MDAGIHLTLAMPPEALPIGSGDPSPHVSAIPPGVRPRFVPPYGRRPADDAWMASREASGACPPKRGLAASVPVATEPGPDRRSERVTPPPARAEPSTGHLWLRSGPPPQPFVTTRSPPGPPQPAAH